jgi:hypothetical protein
MSFRVIGLEVFACTLGNVIIARVVRFQRGPRVRISPTRVHTSIQKLIAILGFMLSVPMAFASITGVYVAQNAQGSGDGSSCSNAKTASYFNTSGNWGSGSSQIGPGTTVHLCGVFTGGNASNILQFQGSGASGSPVTVLFETGAALKPNYCASSGCIDLNGKSFITINGGPTCGETGYQTHVSCNGLIQNMTAGSSGATCPSGSACSPISGSTNVSGIGSNTGSPSNIIIENVHCHMYTRLASDTSDSGTGTYCLGLFGGTLAQKITVQNVEFEGMAKAMLVSLGSGSGKVSGYHMSNSYIHDQCWAMGVGTDAPNMNVTDLLFHDNEVANWDNWAPANTSGNVCHTNGTMWFNGDGNTIHTGSSGYIGDSASGQYNNYLHGNLAGNYSKSSPSGYLSCQDNCIDIFVVNNVINDTSTGADGGGAVYFNGVGGGGQIVVNNTLIRPSGSMTVISGVTANVFYKNNILKCTGTDCVAIEIRPNTPDVVTSDFSGGFQIGSSNWTVYNSAGSGKMLSLPSWQARGSNHDNNSITSNPDLTSTFQLNSGSPAIGEGENLTSLGIAVLNRDAAGVSRPASGNWDAGAFQFGGGPQSPTGLVAIVQ